MSIKVRVSTKSGRPVGDALRKAGADGQRRMVAGLYQEGEGIMAQAKELVPVDTGALRSSGFVKNPVRRGGTFVIELGFGGPAAPYAIKVHEDLQAFHPHGQAKYLEQPVLQAQKGIAERLARDIRRG